MANPLNRNTQEAQKVWPQKIFVASLGTALLAVVLLWVATTIAKTTWYGELATGLASVLLGSVLVAWLGNYFIRREFFQDLENAINIALDRQVVDLRQLQAMGLTHIYQEWPSDNVREEFASSKERIRILQTWVGNFEVIERAMKHAIAQGAIVNILMLKEGSPAAKLRALETGFTSERAVTENIAANKHQLTKFMSECGGKGIEVREYNALPSLQIYAADQVAFIGFFWHGKSSLTGINLKLTLNSAFGAEILREFDWLWEKASPPEFLRTNAAKSAG